jgi:hypothetical protein
MCKQRDFLKVVFIMMHKIRSEKPFGVTIDVGRRGPEFTAVVAVVAYGRYLIGYLHRRKVLEDYLRDEYAGKRSSVDKGRRTTLHLVGALGISEEDLLKAAFGNKR